MADFHNVSVRLKSEDYKKLIYLHEKFNRFSYGKVTIADVLRLAINDLHLKESKDVNKPVALEEQQKYIKDLKEFQDLHDSREKE